jgi:hypothetical protein
MDIKLEVNIGQHNETHHWIDLLRGNNFCSGHMVAKGHVTRFRKLEISKYIGLTVQEWSSRSRDTLYESKLNFVDYRGILMYSYDTG